MKTCPQFLKALFTNSRIPAGLSLILGLWFFLGSGEVLGQCPTTENLTATGCAIWNVPRKEISLTVNPFTGGDSGKVKANCLDTNSKSSEKGGASGTNPKENGYGVISSIGVAATYSSKVIHNFFSEI